MSEKIERLEDLAPELREDVLRLFNDSLYKVQASRKLINLDIIDADEYSDYYYLTPRGAALVNDYQRRHESAASLKDWNALDSRIISDSATAVETLQAENASLFTRIQSILDLAEYYMPGELAENSGKVSADIQEFRDYKALMDKQLAELREENAILIARNQEQERDLGTALKRIEQLKDIVASK